MVQLPRFNYIITIHNKEKLIEQVMMSVLMCCRDNSHVYAVLDGCNDRTEEILNGIIKLFADVPITKVYTSDVHEILSINAGLKIANQDGNGYNIILQDDVLLADFMLEKKVTRLYEWAGSSLGFVSFRLGANFIKDAATSNVIAPFTDFIENAYGHGLPNTEVLLPGQFAHRAIPIKSPVCLPFTLIRSVGLLEERLAPYMYDDVEYAIRSLKAGYRNGVFGIRFHSDVFWGTTRTKPDTKMNEIQGRNMERIRQWHSSEIEGICNIPSINKIVEIPDLVNENDKHLAIEAWNKNQKRLKSFQSIRGLRTFNRIKSTFNNIFQN